MIEANAVSLSHVGGTVDCLKYSGAHPVRRCFFASEVGEVLDAQRTFFAAKAQHLRALAEAHQAAAEIDRVLGDPRPAQPPFPAEEQ